MSVKVRVWDAPTRLFHWALVLCFVCLITTAHIGGAAMAWHFRLGYCVVTLLAFRLGWGFIGGHWSRFKTFAFHPNVVLAHLHGHSDPQHRVGHNPLGAMSVFALLGFLVLQVSTGLMSDDEIAAAGPLARHVSATVVHGASFYHAQIGQLVLLALAGLHVCAVGFYYFRKDENLVLPMLTGDKMLDFVAPSASDTWSDRMKALALALVCAISVAACIAWLT